MYLLLFEENFQDRKGRRVDHYFHAASRLFDSSVTRTMAGFLLDRRRPSSTRNSFLGSVQCGSEGFRWSCVPGQTHTCPFSSVLNGQVLLDREGQRTKAPWRGFSGGKRQFATRFRVLFYYYYYYYSFYSLQPSKSSSYHLLNRKSSHNNIIFYSLLQTSSSLLFPSDRNGSAMTKWRRTRTPDSSVPASS